jgi:hypothetical protein
VAHHDIRVEAKRSIHDDLAGRFAHDGRQPPRLSRVHEQEDCVMLVYQLLQLLEIGLGFFLAGHGVTKHRHGYDMTFGLDTGIYLFQCRCSSESLGLASTKAVLKFKQRLPDGVRK